MECLWCVNPYADCYDDDLCETHMAEYLGYTLVEMDRAEYAEYLDTL
jgi:hypothetical protein